jgi:DNA repair protein RadC
MDTGWVTVREIVVKFGRRAVKVAAPIAGPDSVAALVRKVVGDEPREHLVVVLLDGRNQPIGYRVVSIGTQNASLVHPREVFAGALTLQACAIVVAHTHPSGVATPSAEDWAVTDRLVAAGKILGIPLLDHVVVAPGEYASMQQIRPNYWR